MTTLMTILDAVGWAVLHSIWQGGLIWLAVLGMRRAGSGLSPAVRCNLQLGALALFIASFAVTFFLYFQSGLATAETVSLIAAFNAGSAPDIADATALLSGEAARVPVREGLLSGLLGTDRLTPESLSAITPFVALIWAVGFILFSARYALGYMAAQRLRTAGVVDPSADWVKRFRTLCHKARLARRVRLLISPHVSAPMTLGAIRPVVLVPIGFLTALPPDQVEAILLHELGHIRRNDYLVNLLMTAVKTILFYHPAVHAICRGIERDREEACDDIASSCQRSGSVLARALATLRMLQTQSTLPNSYAMSALGNQTDTPLLRRLARLAGQADAARPEPVMASAFMALLLGSVSLAAPNGAQAHPHTPEETSSLTLSEPVAAPVPPKYPELPDTVISPPKVVAPLGPEVSMPGVLAVPGYDLDMRALNKALAENDKIIARMNSDISRVTAEIGQVAMRYPNDERRIEKLEEKIDDIVDHYEAKLQKQEHKIEEAAEALAHQAETLYEAQADVQMDDIHIDMDVWDADFEDQMEIWEDRIETNLEQQEDQVERVAERVERELRRVERDAERRVREDVRAKREAERTRKWVEKEERRRIAAEKYERFHSDVLSSLRADGLISGKRDKIHLTHLDNVMTLNGSPMPEKVRGKYCDMIDSLGFTDHSTEIWIKDDKLQIRTVEDGDDGRHTINISHTIDAH